MGPILAALLMPQQDVPDRVHSILPSVEYQALDAIEALRDLGRRGLIGITVEPSVRGYVTLSLRNVDWETALQNVTRQIDATYRFERGWLYVVQRITAIDDPPVTMTLSDPLMETYNALAKAVAVGNGEEVRRRLAPDFELRNATETKRGEPAYRGVVEAFRTAKGYDVERTWPSNRGKDTDALLAYTRFGASPIYYRDSWREIDGKLRLASREETVRNPVRRSHNVLLSEVLRAIFEETGVSVRMDPALDRRVTIDLTGGTFETDLRWLVRSADLTYHIEGGVYEIVARQGH